MKFMRLTGLCGPNYIVTYVTTNDNWFYLPFVAILAARILNINPTEFPLSKPPDITWLRGGKFSSQVIGKSWRGLSLFWISLAYLEYVLNNKRRN